VNVHDTGRGDRAKLFAHHRFEFLIVSLRWTASHDRRPNGIERLLQDGDFARIELWPPRGQEIAHDHAPMLQPLQPKPSLSNVGQKGRSPGGSPGKPGLLEVRRLWGPSLPNAVEFCTGSISLPNISKEVPRRVRVLGCGLS